MGGEGRVTQVSMMSSVQVRTANKGGKHHRFARGAAEGTTPAKPTLSDSQRRRRQRRRKAEKEQAAEMKWKAFVGKMREPRFPRDDKQCLNDAIDEYLAEIDMVTQEQYDAEAQMDELLAEIFEQVTLIGQHALHFNDLSWLEN